MYDNVKDFGVSVITLWWNSSFAYVNLS